MSNKNKETKKELIAKDNMSPRRADNISQILELAKQNQDSIILMLDARKDDIVCVYRDKYAATNVRSKFLHLKKHVCRDLLRNKDFEENMGRITMILDGFLFNLVKEINSPKVVDNTNQEKK